MASEVPISDDDYAMAATWAVEHVAALGILGRNVLTDLFSICDKNAHLPARVEQRLVWVLLNDVVEGDGEVSAHVCKMMDKLSPLTAQTSQEVADICVRIRQAVCVRSIDEPAHFAAMVDELFPTNTGGNALLDVASRDMLKVLDAVEGGNDAGKIEEAREMYGVGNRQLRLDLRRFATIHGQKMGGSSVQRLVDDIAAARYDPPGPNRNHASLPRGVREILAPGAALTASPLNASPSPRRKSMLRTASGAPKVRTPSKATAAASPVAKPAPLPAHLAFEDPVEDNDDGDGLNANDDEDANDVFAFNPATDDAWNALGDLAEAADASKPGKVKGKAKRRGKKRGLPIDDSDEDDEPISAIKKRIVEREGRPKGTPVTRTLDRLASASGLFASKKVTEEDDETDEGIMPTQAAPTEEDLDAERKSSRRSLGQVVKGMLPWRKGKGGVGETYPASPEPEPTSPGLHLARIPSPPTAVGTPDGTPKLRGVAPHGLARRHSKFRDGDKVAAGYVDRRKVGRKFWSVAETAALVRGYEQLEKADKLRVVDDRLRPNGGIDWLAIYKTNEELFGANERTTMDLKDKWRNLMKKRKTAEGEERRRASLGAAGATGTGGSRRKSGGLWGFAKSMVGLGGGAENDGSLEDLIPDKDPEPQPPGVANRHSALNKKLGLAPAGRKIKQPWTDEEVEALREGVAKHGKGAWKAVLVESSHAFQDRTTMDLKDKWRNLEKKAAKERAREVQEEIDNAAEEEADSS